MPELQKKAEENFYCAKQAVASDMYNAAISRYYYCALQAAKDYLVNKKNIPESDLIRTERVSSHDIIIGKLIKTICNCETNYWIYAQDIKFIWDFKDIRNDSDYNNSIFCDKTIYNTNHKIKIDRLIRALKEVNVICF